MVTQKLVCGVYLTGKQYLDAIQAPYTSINARGTLQGPCDDEKCGGLGYWCGKCVDSYLVSDVIEENIKEGRIKWGKDVTETLEDYGLKFFVVAHDQDKEWNTEAFESGFFPNLVLGIELSGDRNPVEKIIEMVEEVKDSIGYLKEGVVSWDLLVGPVEFFSLRSSCYCCSDSDDD